MPYNEFLIDQASSNIIILVMKCWRKKQENNFTCVCPKSIYLPSLYAREIGWFWKKAGPKPVRGEPRHSPQLKVPVFFYVFVCFFVFAYVFSRFSRKRPQQCKNNKIGKSIYAYYNFRVCMIWCYQFVKFDSSASFKMMPRLENFSC